jgi:SAM-dependent methyltransferase
MQNTIEDRTRLYRAGPLPDGGSSYRGIREYAKAGLLSHVADLIVERAERGASVLDLGCGAGALALRLSDLGFHVHACDYVQQNVQEDLAFTQADLNGDFSALLPGQFAGIVASEIIEHLENPRHFLREVAKLLAPGGSLVLTTPNTDSPVSHAMLLSFGYHTWFSDDDYSTMGHISPVPARLLRQCILEAGLVVEKLTTWSNAWEHVSHWPRMRLYSHVVALLDRTPKDMRGDILVAIVKGV